MSGFGPYHNRLFDWIWDSVTSVNSEADYNRFLTLYSIPGISNWMDYRFAMESNKRYLARHDLTWSDIKNLRNMPGTAGMRSGMSYGLGWVSRNLDKLYR